MKHHVCTQHKKQTMYMYPYKLTKPSLLWFPPSSRVPPKLVNKPPSVHPLQDFPFVVISAGGEGRATGCQTKFNARPFEGNTDHKHLTGCHINTPQVWQRVRKWKVDMNSSHSRGTDCNTRNQLFQSPSQLSGKHASMWFVVSQKHWFTSFSSCSGEAAGVDELAADEGLNALLSLPCCFFFCYRSVASFCHFIPCLCQADDSCPASLPAGTCRFFGRIKNYGF